MPDANNFINLSVSSQEYAEQHNFFSSSVISSHLLTPLIDYQIAYDMDPSFFIYFGSQNPNGYFSKLVDDVVQNGEQSPFFGTVLCPLSGAINRDADGGKWEYYKNQAFWAGGIDAHRAFYLLTDIAWYYKKGKPDPHSGTCQEILWLLDNGYTAFPDPKNPKATIFIPSSTPGILSIIQCIPEDYQNNADRLALLIESVLKARNQKRYLESCPYKHAVADLNLSKIQSPNRFFKEPKTAVVQSNTTEQSFFLDL